MKSIMLPKIAKGVKQMLDLALKIEANTASCAIMYQPKAPNEIEKYRRNKK